MASIIIEQEGPNIGVKTDLVDIVHILGLLESAKILMNKKCGFDRPGSTSQIIPAGPLRLE